MKKVFWGVLLAMAGLTSVVLTALNLGLILMNAAMPATVWTVCSILAGLGQAYGSGGDFTRNINAAAGPGAAEFAAAAVGAYCERA